MPGATMADDLSRALCANLVDQLYAVPPDRRKRSCWIMNQDWWDECAKLGDWPRSAPGTTILGRPVFVTEDGGFPHLIAD